jgi:D-alanine transaminase
VRALTHRRTPAKKVLDGDNLAMHHLPPLPCYLNGEYTLLPDAKISVMDRGFIFGDGVYEVIPVYAGKPFRFAQHMARLARNLTELRLPHPLTEAQWLDVVSNLIAHYADYTGASAKLTEQMVYIQITRGVAMRNHAMPEDITPTVFAMTNEMIQPTTEQRATGVACVTADDFRWQKAHIKSTSLLGSVFARQISVDAGAVETVMFRDGYLSEAAASNVWVVKNGTVLGPPRDNLVLEGIRYGLIEKLCEAQGLAFELRRIHRDEVLATDELLLSSAAKEVLPVTTLDSQPVGDGLPGPVYHALYAGYQTAKKEQQPL